MLTVQRLKLHDGQKRIVSSPARYKVASCGRRFGKTLVAGYWLTMRDEGSAINGKRTAWFAPTYKILTDAWGDIERSLRSVTKRSSKTDQRIELVTGGVVDFWTLEDKDAGRSRRYHRIVVDEAAHARHLQEAWEKSITPTLTDYRGEAWFISTPNGLNYFHELYQRGGHPDHSDWASFHMPTSANPFIKSEELEAKRRELPERVFRQEYLAEFLADGAGVFRLVDRMPMATWLDGMPISNGVTIGVDWGRHEDFTVFVVIFRGAIVHMDRFHGLGYELQVGRLKALWERFSHPSIIAEENSMGGPLIERLQRDGMSIRPFSTTNASKAEAIESLSLAIENGQLAIAKDERMDVLKQELIVYDQERLPSGMMRYGAPPGMHDDCVMALAIAWHGAKNNGAVVASRPRSDKRFTGGIL